MTTRTDAATRAERQIAVVVELDVDRCTNTYGVAPCTATSAAGGECYNCWATCQDKPNYVRGTVTRSYGLRGQPIPAGSLIRPYVASVDTAPTMIDPEKGLAMRSTTRVRMVDESCADLEDPYRTARTSAAAGGYWARFVARNPNAVGRFARVRRGYVTTPWDWTTFQDELYLIDSIAGPDQEGGVTITLTDVVKLADRVKYPTPTDGKLAAAVADFDHVGVAAGGGSTSITLAADASPVDGIYTGHEVYCYANTAAGQRRVITNYVGATRTATVSAWSVVPDTTTSYQVSPLSLDVGSARAAQYPAAGYVRVSDEIIRYTSNTSGVLAWPDATYREQFNTTRHAHSANAQVQLAAVWIAADPADVLEDLLNAAGIVDANIDLAGLAVEVADWLATAGAGITACLSKPETISSLIGELLRDLNLMAWWDPVGQVVRFRANMPQLSSSVRSLTDDANLILNSTSVDRKDAERITQAGIYYALRTATSDEKQNQNYLRAAVALDTDAESANEYGGIRQSIVQSRWLGTDNDTLARITAHRKLARRRDAPLRFKFRLDPKDEPQVGDLVNLTTARYTGADGQPQTIQVRIVKIDVEPGHLNVEAENTAFGRRYGFIAPNGYPNYTSATDAQKTYAFIATTATGKMSNGDAPYVLA